MTDSKKNLIFIEIPAGYDDAATSITLDQSVLDKLPATPFNMTWFNGTDYSHPALDPNAEIIRVTDKSGGKLTITRAQEGTTASVKNISGKTYYMLLAPTVKTFEDIEQLVSDEANARTAADSALQSQINSNDSDIASLQSDMSNAQSDILNLQSGKVDKVSGKGLSTNDYTDPEKQKLAIIDEHIYIDNPVADLTALANMTGMPDYSRAYVTSEGKYYEYESSAQSGDVASNDPRGGYWSLATGVGATKFVELNDTPTTITDNEVYYGKSGKVKSDTTKMSFDETTGKFSAGQLEVKNKYTLPTTTPVPNKAIVADASGNPVWGDAVPPGLQAAVNQNSINIANLFAQMYLDGKNPDAWGLWFDALADKTKQETYTTLVIDATAGASTIKVAKSFPVGAIITVADSSNYDRKTVNAVSQDTASWIFAGQDYIFTDNFNDGNTKGWTQWNPSYPEVTFTSQIMRADYGNNGQSISAQNIDLRNEDTFQFKFRYKTNSTSYCQMSVYSMRQDPGDGGSGHYLYIGNSAIYVYTYNGQQIGYFYRTNDTNWDNIKIVYKNRSVSGSLIYYDIEVYHWNDGDAEPTTPSLTATHQYIARTDQNTSKLVVNGQPSYNGYYIDVDDMEVERATHPYDLTLDSSLANSYIKGDVVTRNTVAIDTTKNLIDMSSLSKDIQEQVFKDSFLRNDNPNVGNGWIEHEETGGTNQIYTNGNYLVFNGNYASYQSAVTRPMSYLKDTKVSVRYNYIKGYTGSPGNDRGSGVFFKAQDDNNDNGYGVLIIPVNSTGQTNNVRLQLMDNNTIIDTQYINQLNWGNDTNICLHWDVTIDANGNAEVKMWSDTVGESNAKIVNLTGPGATKIKASGSYLKIWNRQPYNYEVQYGDLTIYAHKNIAADNNKREYYSAKIVNQQDLRSANMWLTRNITASFLLDSGTTGATVVINGDQTGKLAVNDTVELRLANKTKRERFTISAIDYNTTNTGKTTITLSGTPSNTYGTSDYLERVDVLPQISMVNTGAAESFSDLSWVKSKVNTDGTVEDEYTHTVTSESHDVKVKINLTRNDTTLAPYAKLPAINFMP